MIKNYFAVYVPYQILETYTLRQVWIRPGLDPTQNPKISKIFRHIESCGICMKY